jgi:hypothetical protein
MSIQSVIDLADDSWVDGFEGAVKKAFQPRQAGSAQVIDAILTDASGAEIKASFWGVSPPQEGVLCSYRGSGMKKTSYQGKAQVRVGDKAVILPISAPAPASSGAAPAANVPAQPVTLPPQVNGQEIGMSVNNAVKILVATYSQKQLNDLFVDGKMAFAIESIADAVLEASDNLRVKATAELAATSEIEETGKPTVDEEPADDPIYDDYIDDDIDQDSIPF